MAAESVQILQNRIRFYDEGVCEVQRLTREIDELKASFLLIEDKIRELAIVSREYELVKKSADECLAALRKRKQKLEKKNSSGDDAKHASDLEGVNLEINLYKESLGHYKADVVASKEELQVFREKMVLIDGKLSQMTSLRNELFEKMLSSVQ